MKRTFIAVKIYPDNSFLNFIRKIQKRFPYREIRWINPSNLHITLRFLGDTTPEQINIIKNAITNIVMDTKSFSFICRGLDVFRSISYPRVLWIGIHNSEELMRIKMEIDKSLDYFIKNEDKIFSPHLTLGRIHPGIDKKNLREIIDEYEDFEFIRVPVKEIIFFESILKKEGAQYHIISSHPLQ